MRSLYLVQYTAVRCAVSIILLINITFDTLFIDNHSIYDTWSNAYQSLCKKFSFEISDNLQVCTKVSCTLYFPTSTSKDHKLHKRSYYQEKKINIETNHLMVNKPKGNIINLYTEKMNDFINYIYISNT